MEISRALYIISSDYPNLISGIGDHTYHIFMKLSHYFENTYVVTTKHNKIANHDHILKIKWSLLNLIKILRLFSGKKTIVLIQYPGILYGKYNIFIYIFTVILKFTKVKLVIYLHEYSNLHILRKTAIVLMFRFANKLIVSTNKEKVLLSHFINPKKVYKVNLFPNFSSSINYSDHSSNIITYFGMIYPDKVLYKVMQAFDEINNAFPNKFLFRCIIGIHENYRKYAEKQIQELQKSKMNIEYFINLPKEEILEYLKGAFLSILKYNDGISLRRGSLLTMCSLGIPIITNSGEERDDFIDVINRGIYLREEINSIKEFINSLKEDKNYYNRISQNLISFSQKFNLDLNKNHILSILQN